MSDAPFLRVPIGPGCWVTVLVSREPSSGELELLIKYLRITIDDPARPLQSAAELLNEGP